MSEAVDRYLQLTRDALPKAASTGRGWPVVNDHCFQRIVLDTICGGVWYDHIARPAYKNLTPDQADRAAQLADDILNGRADVRALNDQSKRWRAAARQIDSKSN